MKNIIAIATLFVALNMFGQVTPSVTENYIHKIVYKEAYLQSQLNTVPNNDKIETVSYFDGLGRPLQSIAVRQGGKDGSNNDSDIVTQFDYDAYGRQAKDHLPLPVSNNDGRIIGSALDDIESYYLAKFPADMNASFPNPYSFKVLEQSPLNRVKEQGAPGIDWEANPLVDTDHSVKFEYGSNATDEVVKYRVIFPNIVTDEPQLFYDGYYDSNTLFKTITKDENWQPAPAQANPNDHTTEEFKDKEGKVILKRTYSDGLEHDTYYVYDEFGNLTYVLSPSGSDAVLSQQSYVGFNQGGKISVLVPTDKYGNPVTGSNGSYSVALNASANTLTVDFNGTFNASITLQTGPIVLLSESVPDMIVGNIIDTDAFYTVSVQNNFLHIEGSGNVREVIENFVVNLPTHSVAQNVLDDLCYQYHYDHRNRLIEKKIPGKGWEYILYDKLDRPRYTQDANLRAQSKWIFTKYDALGRVVYTGLEGGNSTSLQNALNNETTSYESKLSTPITVAGTTLYYTNDSHPTGLDEILTINYYDNYEFDKLWLNPPGNNLIYGQDVTSNTQGLATGNKTKVLGVSPDRWITSVTYYDDDARPIYTRTYYHHEDYHNQQKTQYNFFGQVLRTRDQLRFKSNVNVGGEEDFTYDHSGRVLRHRHKVLEGSNYTPWETLSLSSYDELGQLINKKVGNSESNPLQTVDYSYNIRGWLKAINDLNAIGNDLFAFKLNYNTPDEASATPLYNGNISETYWQSITDSNAGTAKRGYHYAYDPLSRITQGVFIKNGTGPNENGFYNLSSVSYDKNGNIKVLKREGVNNNGLPISGLMDDLVYNYNGNQLDDIIESGDQNYGFKENATQTGDYTYDANGNMITDANKGITSISYNHLNLPTQVTAANGTIQYVYDASGIKLIKMATETGQPTVTTQYAANFQYNDAGTGTDELIFFNHAEGYIEPNGSNYDYIYQYKDHLGNIRLSYGDANGNGSIEPNSEIREENNYYPFGLKHKGYNNLVNGTDHPYGYNGKEEQSEIGLDWHDYGARNYDAALGRWMNIDPLADFAPELTPYRYSANNPIFFSDPSGLWEFVFNDETNTLSLVKTQEDDDWNTLKKQMGLTNSKLKQMFGSEFKNVLDNVEFEGDGIAAKDIGGEIGESIQSFEKALGEYNDDLKKNVAEGGPGGLNNCFGLCESVAETGEVDPNGVQGAGFLFDKFLKENTTNVSRARILDIIRYAYKEINGSNRNKASHGSLFLLKNEKGVQMFTKNGIDNAALYQLMYESEMLKRHSTYGERAGITREVQKVDPTDPTKTPYTEKVKDKSAIYRPNN